MKQPFDRAGIEPTLTEMLADPIVRLVMRRDGLSDADLWRAVRCGRHLLGYDRPALASIGDRFCCRNTVSAEPRARQKCA
jgi:hypothetical protein